MEYRGRGVRGQSATTWEPVCTKLPGTCPEMLRGPSGPSGDPQPFAASSLYVSETCVISPRIKIHSGTLLALEKASPAEGSTPGRFPRPTITLRPTSPGHSDAP